MAVSFICGGNRRTQRKPPNLLQVSDKLYRNNWIFLSCNIWFLLLFLIKKKHFSCGHSISSTTFNVKIIWNLVIQCRLDSDLFALNSKKPKHKNILKRGCVWRLIVFAPFLIIIIIIIILLSFFATWTCPRQISGTTGQNFMKL